MSKLSIQDIFAGPNVVAAIVTAADVFSLTKRKLDLPIQWAARLTDSHGDHRVVQAGGIIEAGEAEEILLVRTAPIDLQIDCDEVGTEDGFLGRVGVQLRLAVMIERGDLDAFSREIMGGLPVVDASTMVRHFAPCVRKAVTKCVGSCDALDLISGSESHALTQSVAQAVEAVCFSCGMKMCSLPRTAFQSDALSKMRVTEQRARLSKEEHKAAQAMRDAIQHARGAHLDRLSDTLARLKELADKSPDVDLPDLMRTFAEHERSDLYEALFATQTVEAKTCQVVVATAHQLLYFDPKDLSQPTERLEIAGEAGPIRSVQCGWHPGSTDQPSDGKPPSQKPDAQGHLLLGGATGVYAISLSASPAVSVPQRTYVVNGTAKVRGGFNAVVQWGDLLLASHSELGLFRWQLGDVDSGEPLFSSLTANAKAIRSVQCHEGRAYCSVDDRIIAWPVDDPGGHPAQVFRGSTATITAVCVSDGDLFAGNSDGQLLKWSLGKEDRPEVIHRGGRRSVESVWVIRSGGVRRLIYTDTSLCVYSRVLGDTFTCRYEASGQTLRRVEVAPDLFAATNDLRDRILYWSPGKPLQPNGLTEVGRLTGQTVQDVCLVPVV